MSNNFKKYAGYYDLIYKDKDYGKECEFIERIFRKYAARKPRSIMDLACGTGSHAISLAERGYKVYGSDISAAMVAIARRKSKERGLDTEFRKGRMQHSATSKKFDAALILFASIDYLTKTKDIRGTFINVSEHLKKNGLFIFDFWNGDAVTRKLIPKSTKIVSDKDMRIKRSCVKRLDMAAHLCEVKFDFSVYKKGKLADSFREKHLIRYFFPEEIRRRLALSGFEILKICPFLKLGRSINEDDWDITVIARRS
ncbi:MAG: class I SAM-dependent methyltransferase [Candidatus Omnitrophota bacterium]